MDSSSTSTGDRPRLVIVGQTPPPWHGQAVATALLFEAPWDGFEVQTIRMAFSHEMEEVGQVRIRKAFHLFGLLRELFRASGGPGKRILLYPPASPNWVPVLRDLVLLPWIRRRFDKVVYIFHAGGLGAWCRGSPIRKWIGSLAYGCPDLSLEVAREVPAPHEVMRAAASAWVPYGVEAPPLPDGPKTRGRVTEVLFVGSLQEGKGVLEVVRTAAELRRRGHGGDFRFKLVGRWFSDRFRAEATALVESLELQTMVDFAGQLTGDEKWAAYHGADVFFFPTHYESEAFPLVLIEALACGLPVVTTRWRGIPDMLEGCESATLCGLKSPAEFATALLDWRAAASHPEARSRAARAFYDQRYLPEQFLEQVRILVAGLLTDPVAPARRVGGDEPGFRMMRAERRPLRTLVYLADQNPKLGRSLGISRMTEAVLDGIGQRTDLELAAVVSRSSVAAPGSASSTIMVPWPTRARGVRVLTDNLHPLLTIAASRPDVWYFPKGFMPRLRLGCSPAVATIHDTIIQYYQDRYPKWRFEAEYSYWAAMLRNTLANADAVMTVSENAKGQIEEFIARHNLPKREIFVTYEPCLYESLPQPDAPAKANYVLHLGSKEPHKRTEWLVRSWAQRARIDDDLPKLHVVGSVPDGIGELARKSSAIVMLPYLEDQALVSQITAAKALLLPSEVEGFGLPAIEAYYLGTPVCYQSGTSVEEVLGIATRKGGFQFDDPESMFRALAVVLSMPCEEIRECGLKLRETYDSAKVVERMMEVFEKVAMAG